MFFNNSMHSEVGSEEDNKNKTLTTELSMTVEWNEDVEDVIKKIRENCERYKISNLVCSKREIRKYNTLMYLLILIGPLAGVLTSIQDDRAIQLTVIFLSFFSGVISAIVRFSKFNQKSAQHKSISARFASLSENISRQLRLKADNRISAGSYLKWISKSYDDLYAIMPLSSTMIREIGLQSVKIEKEEDKGNKEKIEIKKEAPTEVKKDENTLDTEQFSDSRMEYELARLGKNVDG